MQCITSILHDYDKYSANLKQKQIYWYPSNDTVHNLQTNIQKKGAFCAPF